MACKKCGGEEVENKEMRDHIPGGRGGSTTYKYYTCMGCGAKTTHVRDTSGLSAESRSAF